MRGRYEHNRRRQQGIGSRLFLLTNMLAVLVGSAAAFTHQHVLVAAPSRLRVNPTIGQLSPQALADHLIGDSGALDTAFDAALAVAPAAGYCIGRVAATNAATLWWLTVATAVLRCAPYAHLMTPHTHARTAQTAISSLGGNSCASPLHRAAHAKRTHTPNPSRPSVCKHTHVNAHMHRPRLVNKLAHWLEEQRKSLVWYMHHPLLDQPSLGLPPRAEPFVPRRQGADGSSRTARAARPRSAPPVLPRRQVRMPTRVAAARAAGGGQLSTESKSEIARAGLQLQRVQGGLAAGFRDARQASAKPKPKSWEHSLRDGAHGGA